MLSWVKSFSEHPAFIEAFVHVIKDFLLEKGLDESQTLLFFSPHGLPVSYVFEGDVYKKECERSLRKILRSFPDAGFVMGYQSQFGRAEWLKPYTNELAESIKEWNEGYPSVVFIPLSFTSDHIETLFEVENQYVPLVKEAGFAAYRCPALNRRSDWVDAVERILQESDLCSTQMLIRSEDSGCACKGRVT
jgi:ferrochelatase